MNSALLSNNTYRILFGLLGIVYVIGLFVPLMDNDSAHHANIALRMYLTGDYVNLVDAGKDYLDKPHLHFWLAAFSYHLFGVTSFAYKFPSFLFTLLGTYATYRLGKSLYDTEVGKLAALIVASAFAFTLANNDVRMDAILTASVVFATWQLVDWVQHKKISNALGAALGLALGFATKGHIAVVTAGLGALFYILYRKDWRSLYHGHLLVMIAAFFVLISPVVYAYYVQYDLHPEKVVRGRNNISGVKFILWQQNFERFQGDSFGADAKHDYFFFLHSFLWAFAPWSVLAFWAFFSRLHSFVTRRYEWLTLGTFAAMALLLSFSGFKLPHYLNIIFPASAVLTASFIVQHRYHKKKVQRYAVIQTVLCVLLLLAAGLVNVWAFPVYQWWVIAGFFIMAAAGYFVLKQAAGKLQRTLVASVVASALLFYVLNANFYPQLLTYQAGNELAKVVNKHIGGENVYMNPDMHSWSLNFYTRTVQQNFHDSLLTGGRKVWIATVPAELPYWQQNYRLGRAYRHRDYEITRLDFRFINPATRKQTLGELILVEVLGKRP